MVKLKTNLSPEIIDIMNHIEQFEREFDPTITKTSDEDNTDILVVLQELRDLFNKHDISITQQEEFGKEGNLVLRIGEELFPFRHSEFINVDTLNDQLNTAYNWSPFYEDEKYYTFFLGHSIRVPLPVGWLSMDIDGKVYWSSTEPSFGISEDCENRLIFPKGCITCLLGSNWDISYLNDLPNCITYYDINEK